MKTLVSVMRRPWWPSLRLGLTGMVLSTPMAVFALSLPGWLYKPEWVLPEQVIARSASPQSLPRGTAQDLNGVLFQHQGGASTLREFLKDGHVSSYLVLHQGQVVFEHHSTGHGADSLHQSFSMMKQLVGLMVGMALADKAIASVDDPMDRYAPELQGTAFEGVTFRQALTMSSGVAYAEETARVQLFVKAAVHRATGGWQGMTMRQQVLDPALKRGTPPGKRYEYTSITTQVLQLALEGATRQPLGNYMQARLWQPMGMPDDARLLTDGEGGAFSLCCLHATARSYAALGQMMAQGGRFNGRQIVPARWVQLSTTFTDPAAWRARDVPRTAKRMNLFGFAYHWWPMEGPRGDFTALGIRGQSIYVSPRQNVVVVRLSDDDAPGAHAEEAALLARAIADRLSPLK
jgi:CubicO group peptidase (beta-lactamase class C family)